MVSTARDVASATEQLNSTWLASRGPAQLEVANVTVTLPSRILSSRQVLYVDVACGDALFRTTAQARKFDPLASAHCAPLQFETDRGHLTLDMPLSTDTKLSFTVRRCQIFGDGDVCRVSIPVGLIPLIRGQPRVYLAGCFSFLLLATNIGTDPLSDRPQGDEPISLTALSSFFDSVPAPRNEDGGDVPDEEGCDVPDEEGGTQPGVPPQSSPSPDQDSVTGQRPNRGATLPPGQHSVPPTTQFFASTDQAPARPAGQDSTRIATLPPGQHSVPPTTQTAAAPVQAAVRDTPANVGPPTAVGMIDEALHISRSSDPLKPLTYRGTIPKPEDAPRVPFGYQRNARLQKLMHPVPPTAQLSHKGTFSNMLAALTETAASAVVDLGTSIDSERMRSAFPVIRSPLVTTFKPHVLNGHGTPIQGVLYVTTNDVAFNGPLLQFHYPLSSIYHLRRTTAFGKDCIQLFCPDSVAYQLQDFDGFTARLGSSIGLRSQTAFYSAYCLLLDLWRLAHNLPVDDSGHHNPS